MGNSTRTLQNVVDYAKTIGDLMVGMPVGGYTNFLALEIANDVMAEMLAQRFNWKFNRLKVPVFYTNSWQQDYASVNVANVGWLEHAIVIDINNTALPKPIFWLEAVRDLEQTSYQFGTPQQICWLPNSQLVQAAWPGAGIVIGNPVGANGQPANPIINILDASGNILILTTFGTTGAVAPDAGANPAVGTTVNDNTCVWTVANPAGQGFRISPLPSQTGVVYQVNVIAQARPPLFSQLGQFLDPIPDDFSRFFRDGFVALSHEHAVAPAVRGMAEKKKALWLAALADARGQGDREKDSAGFVPATNLMDEACGYNIGPAWPFPPR